MKEYEIIREIINLCQEILLLRRQSFPMMRI